MAAHQFPPSLGFFRQEHWSGLPFPSPMHKSESEIAQSCPTPRNPTRTVAHQAPPSTRFSRQEYWSGPEPFGAPLMTSNGFSSTRDQLLWTSVSSPAPQAVDRMIWKGKSGIHHSTWHTVNAQFTKAATIDYSADSCVTSGQWRPGGYLV